jgi:hypothetical protein
VVQVSRSRWRWLALAYPGLTVLAVTVTANHYWLDGIVAALLLGLVLLVQRAARGALGRVAARRRASTADAAEPSYVPVRPPVDA